MDRKTQRQRREKMNKAINSRSRTDPESKNSGKHVIKWQKVNYELAKTNLRNTYFKVEVGKNREETRHYGKYF